MAVTILVTAVLTGVFTSLALVVLYWNTPELWGEVVPGRALQIAGLLALAQGGYCSLFGVLSLLTRRSLIAGLAYIVIFEGRLANSDFVGRRLTVMYYFRVLTMRWLNPPDGREWRLDLTTAPSAGGCVMTLLAACSRVPIRRKRETL